MKCELIFYLAGRTGQLEDLLQECLSGLGIGLAEVTAATNEEELAAAVGKGVSRRNLLLIAGGLSKPDDQNTARQMSKLLSLPLSSVNPPVFRNGISLSAGENRPGGFFLESGRQSLLLLPDDPDVVEALLDRQALTLLQKKYGLSSERREEPERRARELQEEIQESEQALGGAVHSQAPKSFGAAPCGKKKGSKKALWLLLVLAVIVLAAVAALLMTHRLPGLESWVKGLFPSLRW